ncbi:MFS transporter [Brevibacterium sp. 5221]|uniref:MFS transporter n=1 Tax=Brevibacterium rongguiense TaxID=2695267 RepID=A0A6N9H940_9MICO|nr:MFS transporter [Brevibacterium rongguiense]MYM20610.1 MFS transporter [Brevibacterium rongguiense]
MFGALARVMGWGFFPLSLLAKLPYAMSVVAVMTSVSAVTGSYGQAGATAALVGAGTAVSGPLLGAAADRFGQRPVLVWSALANAAALAALALCLRAGAPAWAQLAMGLLIGLSAPQASSMVRSRWLYAIPQRFPAERAPAATSAVLSYESMTDEFVFVLGPVITGAVAVALGVVVPLDFAALLTVAGVVGFALHPSARYARGRERGAQTPAGPDSAGAGAAVAPVRALFSARILLPVAGMMMIGFFFGATLASLTAFMETRGDAAATGLYYGIMGIGSAICALGTAWLPRAFGLGARWAAFSLLVLAGSALLHAVPGLPGTVVAMIVMGCGVGPTLVTLFSIASAVAPLGRTTTVMAMMSSALVVGQALSSALTGAVIDAAGFAAGYWAVSGAALVLVALWALNAALGRRARRRTRLA